MLTQIYGITHPDDAAAVNALRPDHVGVVLEEPDEATWDSVNLPVMRQICAELTDVRIVALSLATGLDAVLRTVDAVDPEIIHLARAGDAMTPDLVERIRSQIRPIEVMATIPVRDQTCVLTAQRFEGACDWLLLDSAHPDSGVVGATGYAHDWNLSRAVVEAAATPVLLAGGLGPHNVEDAIRRVGPAGVDSETQTSRSDDRRRKDLGKVAQCLTLAGSNAP